jgi:putative transposase
LTRVDEGWISDITSVPMRHSVMYLTEVIDLCSRYVLSWRLSNTLDGHFCLEALDEGFSLSRPEIFNTDKVRSSRRWSTPAAWRWPGSR